jgi:hypothetical protein
VAYNLEVKSSSSSQHQQQQPVVTEFKITAESSSSATDNLLSTSGESGYFEGGGGGGSAGSFSDQLHAFLEADPDVEIVRDHQVSRNIIFYMWYYHAIARNLSYVISEFSRFPCRWRHPQELGRAVDNIFSLSSIAF